MLEMSAFWLRAGAALYGVGLVHALAVLLRRGAGWFRVALAAFVVGLLLQVVSIVEQTVLSGHFPANNFFQSASLCAVLSAASYLWVWWRYRLETLATFVFPVVFMLSLVGVLGQPTTGWGDQRVRDLLLVLHVTLVLAGYAALLITVVAAVVYLFRERQLKSKPLRLHTGNAPALGTLDELIGRGMTAGFVLITLAVIVGSVWASVDSGTRWIRDARIVLSLLTWGFYLAMVFLRASAGWRGRKAALMVITVMGCSLLTWAAHTSLRTLLK